MLEMPEYRTPVWRNVGVTVWQKVKTFIEEAGKIILLISVILWALSSYGPSEAMDTARTQVQSRARHSPPGLRLEDRHRPVQQLCGAGGLRRHDGHHLLRRQ